VRKGEEETIVIKVAVPHQKEYINWTEQLAKVGRQEALLLPLSHSFAKEGFCGLSGTADVPLSSCRSSMKTTPSFFPTKSTTENVWAQSSSKKTNSGTWCSLF
jgi:hypothetical protein